MSLPSFDAGYQQIQIEIQQANAQLNQITEELGAAMTALAAAEADLARAQTECELKRQRIVELQIAQSQAIAAQQMASARLYTLGPR